jgi:hypothetical protein
MSWKRGFFVLLAVLIASNLAWLYAALDFGVTASYAAVSHQEDRADLAVLRRMLPEARGMRRSDVLALLRRTNPGALIVDDSAGVSIGGLRFQFTADRLTYVSEYGR